jgi:hypothetical protein
MALQLTYLISDNTIKEASSILQNVDPKFLRSGIRRAQEINLRSTLGYNLYNKIITLVGNGTITNPGNEIYNTLREEYITLMLVEYSIYHAIIEMSYKFSNTTTLQLTANEGAASSLNDLKFLLHRQLSYAAVYDANLKRYLLENSALYPELYSNSNIQETPANLANYEINDLVFRNSSMANPYNLKIS